MLGPRSMGVSRPVLQSQRSAKHLIHRYEELSSPINPLSPPKLPLAAKKDKSPLRQSFRNLFAVLKKGGGMRNAKSKLQECTPAPIVEQPVEKPPTPPAMAPPTLSTQSFPAPSLAGSVFYLSRLPNSAHGPLSWSFCSAVLQGDSVHLTWPNTASSHSIHFKSCTDVRSMTPDELDPEERALLPADMQDLKIFQVRFDANSAEKFGTTSVRERARWVSSIWDIILPSGSVNSSSYRTDSSHSVNTDASVNRRSTVGSYRALPPLPESPTSPVRSSRLAVSPSVYPPSRPESCASPRSTSPSIANLSHLSVVKHRLAQIESSQQSRSVPSSPSALCKNPSLARTRSLRIEIPTQPVVAQSFASPTSIMDSYGDRSAPSNQRMGSDMDEGTILRGHALSTTQQVYDAPQHDVLQDIHQLLSDVDEPPAAVPELGSITRTLGDVQQKLRSDMPYIMKSLADIQASQQGPESQEKVRQMVEAPLEDASQRNVQSQQQTDSVRYLNELNSWLETFVSGGTAQIQVVSANVEKMCQELGCIGETNARGNILGDLRNLLATGQMRDHIEALQHSINNLTAMVVSESRGGFTPQTVANLVEKQRHDHEGLFRALAAGKFSTCSSTYASHIHAELSNEIRGERLRFVDAMKEATAINVQMHVEELKKELNREVRADLFEYYSKQRPAQTGCAPGQIYPHQARMVPVARGMPDTRYGGYASK
ncbi:hypothetical protein C8F01DRAFT_1076413 [Mycena amicta]|nr:hypothetical protein C8F01DRAFT_1076413 [Mycena amicta]